MENDKKLSGKSRGAADTENTIPLDEAVLRIKAYREYAAGIFPPGEVTKAIFIPIDDVVDIISRFKHSDEANGQDISGVRVYFSLLPDQPNDKFVRGLVVPVRDDGTDIVITDPQEESSIYDFTAPCPSYCDKISPLFNA